MKNRMLGPLYRAGDAGGGGGAAPGAGDSGGPTPGGSGGGAPAFKLTDDALVDLGDGKAAKWSEVRGSRYMPRDEYDRGMAGIAQGREFLLGQAQRLEQAWKQYSQGQGPRPQERRPSAAELAEEARSLPVVDGATVYKMMQALHEQGLGPIANLLAQQQAKLTALEGQFGTMRGAQSTLTEQHTNQTFDNLIARHAGALGEIQGFRGQVDPQEPAVRELLKDIWLSHNQAEWTDQSFLAEARSRIAAMVEYVRRADRSYVDKQKEEKRQRFFNPARGNVQPGGAPAYQHKNGTTLARDLFAMQRGDQT